MGSLQHPIRPTSSYSISAQTPLLTATEYYMKWVGSTNDSSSICPVLTFLRSINLSFKKKKNKKPHRIRVAQTLLFPDAKWLWHHGNKRTPFTRCVNAAARHPTEKKGEKERKKKHYELSLLALIGSACLQASPLPSFFRMSPYPLDS